MDEETVKELRSHLSSIEKIITEKCPEAEYIVTIQMDNKEEDEAVDVFYGVKAESSGNLIDMFSNVYELACAENPPQEEFDNFLGGFGIMGASGEV